MYLFILWSRIGFGFESKKYSLEYVILVAEMIAALAEIYFPEVTNFPEGVFIFLYPREENIGYVTTPDVVEDSYDESSNKRSMYENLYLSEWTLCQGLYFMGYLEKAKAIGGRVFERQKNLHWEDTWQNSFSLKEEIQYVLSILGMTEEALLICKRLYTLHLRIYGDEHENTIHSMELLSRRLEEFGELDIALKLQRKVFVYDEENRSDDDPIVVKSLFDVAKTLIELGITEEAEQLYRTAIDLQVKLPGEAHVTTLKIKIE